MATETNMNQVTISEVGSLVRTLWNNEHTKDYGVFFWGPPGCAKTQGGELLAKEAGLEVLVKLTATMDPTDVQGCPFPLRYTEEKVKKLSLREDTSGITQFFPPDDLFMLTEGNPSGPDTLVLFDDMPAAHDQVFPALFRFMQQREVCGLKIRDNVKILGTGNRVQDKAGAKPMPTALNNRMIHFLIEVSVEEWRQWAFKQGLCPEVVGFIGAQESMLHDPDFASRQDAFYTPRSVEMAARIFEAAKGESEDAISKLMAATCGDSWATQFIAYLVNHKRLVPAEDILKDPENCELPADDLSVMFATTTNLTSHLLDKQRRGTLSVPNVKAAWRYALRIPRPEQGGRIVQDVAHHVMRDHEDYKFRTELASCKEMMDISEAFEKVI
jgi:hypothetical protein